MLLLLACCMGWTLFAGHPCAHVLICCRTNNDGVTFEVGGEFLPDHDYRDIEQVRSIVRRIKEAGIQTIIIDMTNPSQWTRFWPEFEPMVENLRKVTKEEGMEYFLFIGSYVPEQTKMNNGITMDSVPFWNSIAKRIYETYATDAHYRRYGHGDNRPILLAFVPGSTHEALLQGASTEDQAYWHKFRVGTTQVNDPVPEPMESDGWGYRTRFGNPSGNVRFVSPNSGVHPTQWGKMTAEQWEKDVRWAKEAKEYSIYGSYDDTCDSIFWGIADTSKANRPHHRFPDPGNPRFYYDILKSILHAEQAP